MSADTRPRPCAKARKNDYQGPVYLAFANADEGIHDLGEYTGRVVTDTMARQKKTSERGNG